MLWFKIKETNLLFKIIFPFLRQLIQPENVVHCIKLMVVLKWRDICIENIKLVSLTGSPEIEGSHRMKGS